MLLIYGDLSMKISIIVPSLNPDEKLNEVVDSLIKEGFDDIILVNDGSDKDHLDPFERAQGFDQCTVLTHEVNKGKGRGLKTAFEYCIANRKDIDGVVAVDGDNQHRAKDIIKCCKAMVESGNVVLGVRNFDQSNVPARSKFGNKLTSGIFKVLCGLKISDTQTGLRAIPYKYLDTFTKVDGERYEYETNQLLAFKDYDIPFEEVEIETVYIDDNESSHFNPIKDSIKIYKVIFKHLFASTGFKYTLSSIASWLIDNLLFNVLNISLLAMADDIRIGLATGIARVLSSIFNFTINKKMVFKSKEGLGKTFVRYYILWACQLAASFGCVLFFERVLALKEFGTGLCKIIVDLLLFLLSYQIQKRWVFKKK